jgi:hypothetical protein
MATRSSRGEAARAAYGNADSRDGGGPRCGEVGVGYAVRAAVAPAVADAVARVMAATGGGSEARDALRSAFVARALNALSEIVPGLDDAELGRAVGAATDRAVLLRALASSSAASPTPAADPLAAARVRGLQARDRILAAEGGTLTVGEVAAHLRISRQAVDKRRAAGKLIGLDMGRHGYGYPAWQFGERGLLPGLDRVLAELRVVDPWMRAGFFLGGDPRLDRDTPLDRLRRGDVDAAVHAARAYGQHGGA